MVHGAYSSRRELDPEARKVADQLMQAGHVVAIDRTGAEEIGALVVQLGRIDAALADGMVEHLRSHKPRALIEMRARLSRTLRDWLAQYGMTPQSRAAFVAELARGSSLARELSTLHRGSANGS